LITSKISHERPLGAVLTMWGRELMAPRERMNGDGGAVSASRVRVRATRPVGKNRRRSGSRGSRPIQYHQGQDKPQARRDRGPVSAGR
jgi:hypothetical protein